MSSSPRPQPTAHDSARCSRRDYLERIGVTAGTLVTVGAAGDRVAPQLSPVGRAQAIAPAAVAFYLATGAAAGIATDTAANMWLQPETDLDPEDVLEDQIYEAAASVADGREEFVRQIETEFVAPSDAEATPFGRAAWQEIRSEVVLSATNGESESTALENATDGLDRAATRSVINLYERWNTGMRALAQQLVVDVEESIGSMDIDGTADIVAADATTSYSTAEILEAGTSDSFAEGESVLWEIPVETPIPPTEIEGRDEDLSVVALAYNQDGTIAYPATQTAADGDGDWVAEAPSDRNDLLATHSSNETITVLGTMLFSDALDTVATAYDQIQTKLNDYVSNLYSGIQQGAIDPSDILSSSDIIDEFADSDQQSRVAAELLAVGANVPDDAGFQAEISHPDLEAESLWGMLYPQFSGDPIDITPGTTLEPTDYDLAYFGFESQLEDSDEWLTETLSGEETLEVLDVSGVEGQETISQESDEAGTGGRVVLWTGDDPPDSIQYPADHAGWKVIVQGDVNRHVADVGDVAQDGEDWVLETTSLAENETIDYVEIVPSVNYSRSIDYVADETNVDSEQTIERLETLRTQVDDLEDALEDDGGGGIGDWFDGGGAGGPIIGALIALAAIVGIGQITS